MTAHTQVLLFVCLKVSIYRNEASRGRGVIIHLSPVQNSACPEKSNAFFAVSVIDRLPVKRLHDPLKLGFASKTPDMKNNQLRHTVQPVAEIDIAG